MHFELRWRYTAYSGLTVTRKGQIDRLRIYAGCKRFDASLARLRKDMALVAPPHGSVACAEQHPAIVSCGTRFLA